MNKTLLVLALTALSAQAANYTQNVGNNLLPESIDAGFGIPKDPNAISFVVNADEQKLELGFSWVLKGSKDWSRAEYSAVITNETQTYCGSKLTEASQESADGTMVDIILIDTREATKCSDNFEMKAPVSVVLTVWPKDEFSKQSTAVLYTNSLIPTIIPGI